MTIQVRYHSLVVRIYLDGGGGGGSELHYTHLVGERSGRDSGLVCEKCPVCEWEGWYLLGHIYISIPITIGFEECHLYSMKSLSDVYYYLDFMGSINPLYVC